MPKLVLDSAVSCAFLQSGSQAGRVERVRRKGGHFLGTARSRVEITHKQNPEVEGRPGQCWGWKPLSKERRRM